MHKKPDPLVFAATPPRRLCPVCGTTTYSREGIHPQCAEQQSDAPRMELVKAAKRVAQETPAPASIAGLSPWQKACPKCQAQLHIRRLTCDCGHEFDVRKR